MNLIADFTLMQKSEASHGVDARRPEVRRRRLRLLAEGEGRRPAQVQALERVHRGHGGHLRVDNTDDDLRDR